MVRILFYALRGLTYETLLANFWRIPEVENPTTSELQPLCGMSSPQPLGTQVSWHWETSNPTEH